MAHVELVIRIPEVYDDINKLHKVGNANDGRVYVPINDVFDVIDKYKTESRKDK